MPYICVDHQIGYEEWSQVNGHWTNRHKGEARPTREGIFVEDDQVPEGVQIAARPTPKPPAVPPPVASASSPSPSAKAPPAGPSPSRTDEEEDDATRLGRKLKAIGATQKELDTILLGVREFGTALEHPANLYSFLASSLSNASRAKLPWVMAELYPGAQPEEETPYFYPGPSPTSRGGGYAPYWQQPPSPYAPGPRAATAMAQPLLRPTRQKQPRWPGRILRPPEPPNG